MSFEIPCRYCSMYYGHSLNCFTNSLTGVAEKMMFMEVSRRHGGMIHDLEQENAKLRYLIDQYNKLTGFYIDPNGNGYSGPDVYTENNKLREMVSVCKEALEKYADCNEYDRKECEKVHIAQEALAKLKSLDTEKEIDCENN